MPRILRDVANVDMSTTIFGSKVSMPFGFAPAAMHCLAHPDGEVATSTAAAKAGIAMGLSNWATKSLEEVIDAGKEVGNDTPYAIQTSTGTPKPYIEALLRRAAKAGYSAVLLTVDAPTLGRRLNEYVSSGWASMQTTSGHTLSTDLLVTGIEMESSFLQE
jgi:(S)-2-hydroxy-acid oxidase